ncbi:unnamed protein product [Amoebophrya sp. A120]|nr:unnamed protein product [Amoebophrya sp. A120]|eukprot:GSA120T00020456001.1
MKRFLLQILYVGGADRGPAPALAFKVLKKPAARNAAQPARKNVALSTAENVKASSLQLAAGATRTSTELRSGEPVGTRDVSHPVEPACEYCQAPEEAEETTKNGARNQTRVLSVSEEKPSEEVNVSNEEQNSASPQLQLALNCPGSDRAAFLDCFVPWDRLGDPTQGAVNYQEGWNRRDTLITQTNDNKVSIDFAKGRPALAPDDRKSPDVGSDENGNRYAIRMHSKFGFTYGSIFVVDVERMPAIDGSWPAYWTAHKGGVVPIGEEFWVPRQGYWAEDGWQFGHAHWPESGEFDMMEHVHGFPNKEMITTLHTEFGPWRRDEGACPEGKPCVGNCNMFRTKTNRLNPTEDEVGDDVYEQCRPDPANEQHWYFPDNQCPDYMTLYLKMRNCEGYDGCGVLAKGIPNGIEFNKEQGGIHIMKLGEDKTDFYWIPRKDANAISAEESAQPEFWETKLQSLKPYVVFPLAHCSEASEHFRTQTFIINTAFCGSWAGTEFQANGNDQGIDACNALVKDANYGKKDAKSIYPGWDDQVGLLMPTEHYGTNFVFNSVKVFAKGGKGVGYFDWTDDRMLNGEVAPTAA